MRSLVDSFGRITVALVVWAGPVAAQSITAAQPQDVGVKPGVPIPSGVGSLADPSLMHGLTIGLQAGLGASAKSGTFGFDNLVVNLRWTPGTNRLGRRLSLVGAVADWRIPAVRDVYPEDALTGLAASDTLAARSDSRASIGFEYVFAGGRRPEPNDRLWAQVKPKIDALRVQQLQAANNPLEEERLSAEADSIKWREFIRPVSRRSVWQAGILTRMDAFTAENDLTAFDSYLAWSKGKGIFDFSSAIHYLGYIDRQHTPRNAMTAALGGYWDLADAPPAPVLGLSFGAGRYRYRSMNEITDGAVESSLEPSTVRYDIVLSFSGAPDSDGGNAAGVGFRYTRLSNSDVRSRNQFSVVLSTNFRLLATP